MSSCLWDYCDWEIFKDTRIPGQIVKLGKCGGLLGIFPNDELKP